MKRGVAGALARQFLFSKLTPLIIAFSLMLGAFAIGMTPREEEPQIVVPMVDVMVSFPGATPAEVEDLVTNPLEKLLWEIDGVEYVYSMSQPGQSLAIVRFYVGENTEASLVKLYTKLMANYDRIPSGVSQPLIKARSIDDVPVLALSIWSPGERYGGYELRRVAMEVADELKKGPSVAEIQVTGGQKREMRVELDPVRLKAYGMSPLVVQQTLQKGNITAAAGSYIESSREVKVEGRGFLTSQDDVERVMVGVSQGRPVYLRDVARVVDGPGEVDNVCLFQAGPAAAATGITEDAGSGRHEAVTLSLAKKKGTNATDVVKDALRRMEELKGDRIPRDIAMTVTRNYGATAKEKSDELLEHILIATLSVVALIWLFLGWREAVVVLVAVPVTLALTLLINYLYGYTLNRVTLFALIFSIGILVDDAIVVVENIHRRFQLDGVAPESAVEAVDEVGNPTILATVAVIAALLPMAFVRGLMGPYMRPIPVGASAAMIFSLLVAFIVTPWLAYKLLRHVSHAQGQPSEDKWGNKYRSFVGRLLVDRNRRRRMLAGIVGMLVICSLLIPFKAVLVKMMPFDNKSEFQVVVDMPEGTSLQRTQLVLDDLLAYLITVPEVSDCQAYAGTSSPYNFNGLIRHYYLRKGGYQGDIQVNLVDKGRRKDQSHDIARRVRPELEKIAASHGAKLKLAEIPPGPPVMSTLVAEVYAVEDKDRTALAEQVLEVFRRTQGVLEPDFMMEADQRKEAYVIERDKAAFAGISVAEVNAALQMGLQGTEAGLLHRPKEKEPVVIRLRMPPGLRDHPQLLQQLSLQTATGNRISLAELVSVKNTVEDKTIYHKNLQPVLYVTGDAGGRYESPGYAVLSMKDTISRLGKGGDMPQYFINQPEKRVTAVKWDGEIHITAEVFRDLGMAFAAVLILIFVLVVAWFRSFVIPLVIMAPIPLTLVGILPAHAITGAFFTATSMIGFIALAGIIVRNSLLLVDFIQQAREEGMPVDRAILEAGAVRMRPIILTAAAVVVGSIVMLFDPIFQGLALSMMFGALAATALTLVVVPLLYFELVKWIDYGNKDNDCKFEL